MSRGVCVCVYECKCVCECVTGVFKIYDGLFQMIHVIWFYLYYVQSLTTFVCLFVLLP